MSGIGFKYEKIWQKINYLFAIEIAKGDYSVSCSVSKIMEGH